MKYLIAVGLLLALVACASTPEPLPEPPAKPISDSTALEAIQLYNLAEFSYQQNELENALELLQRAEQHDPSSATIRNRISEILLELAMDDSEFLPLLLGTTFGYFQSGYHSSEVLSSLADGYFLDGQSDRGLKIFEELVEIDDSALNLYKYYLLQLQYFNVERPELLDDALEKSWDNPRMVMILANQIKSADPDRAEGIFVKAWSKFQDEESLIELVNYYRETAKFDQLTELLTGLMTDKRGIDGWMREILLRNLFIMQQNEVIIENHAWFLDSDIDLTDTRLIVFGAAFSTGNDSLMVAMCDALVDSGMLTDANRNRYLSLTGSKLMKHNDIERAAAFFNRVNSPEVLISQLHELRTDSTRVLFERTLDVMQETAPNDTLNALLHAMIEQKCENYGAALSWIEKVDSDYIQRNELTIHAAEIYIAADMPQVAAEIIERDSTLYVDPEAVIGLKYYQLEKYDLVIQYLEPYLNESPDTGEDLYVALAYAFKKSGNDDRTVEVFRQGLDLYPLSSSLNNDLAYLLAESGSDLDQAWDIIQTALEQEPNQPNILDTAAWVQYKLGNNEKALEYIEKALDRVASNTSILYHAGMIYHASDQHEKAKQSLQDAVLFDNDEEDAEKARSALKDFYKITLEDK